MQRDRDQQTIADLGRQAIRDNHTIIELRAANKALTEFRDYWRDRYYETDRELDRWKSGAQHETRTDTSLYADECPCRCHPLNAPEGTRFCVECRCGTYEPAIGPI